MGIDLQPGPKLNTLVAVHVMGLTLIVVKPGDGLVDLGPNIGDGYATPGLYVKKDATLESVRPYSEDWGCFGELVAAMKAKGYEVSIHTHHQPGWTEYANVGWFITRKAEPTDADGETVPHAGCLAALEVVGYKGG